MDATVFDYMRRFNFKKVVLCNDSDSGLRAVIAIHSTALGPATGGTRMWTYASEQDAIMDAMRLARGMTYKYAAAAMLRECDEVFSLGVDNLHVLECRANI